MLILVNIFTLLKINTGCPVPRPKYYTSTVIVSFFISEVKKIRACINLQQNSIPSYPFLSQFYFHAVLQPTFLNISAVTSSEHFSLTSYRSFFLPKDCKTKTKPFVEKFLNACCRHHIMKAFKIWPTGQPSWSWRWWYAGSACEYIRTSFVLSLCDSTFKIQECYMSYSQTLEGKPAKVTASRIH